jgi:threonine/homoserine efflux transporter RhtA
MQWESRSSRSACSRSCIRASVAWIRSGSRSRSATRSAGCSTIVGSILLVPGAAATGGLPFGHLRELVLLAAAGALSAGLPYLVELFVMKCLTTRAFSVLQALYPAASVAVGAIGLGQRLRPVELGGIALVTAASALALEGVEAVDAGDHDRPNDIDGRVIRHLPPGGGHRRHAERRVRQRAR